MEHIAVVTSGGDAPGMNSAIRAIVRVGGELGMAVTGVWRGYDGLLEGDMSRLTNRDVSGIVHRGGTFLGTARNEEFKTDPELPAVAVDNLRKRGIQGLIVIGGNGSQRGSAAISREGFPVAGVASTVDNDLYGSDICVGVDTALDIILESIDRIRTTAESHHRAFVVETMGRDFGYLAMMSGIAGGADVIVTPEFDLPPEEVEAAFQAAHASGKKYALAVVTDGSRNNAGVLKRYFDDHLDEIGYELRVTILGHVQRGGPPHNFDRILAARLGAEAVRCLSRDQSGHLVGWRDHGIAHTPFTEVVSNKKSLDMELWQLGKILAR